MLVVMANEDGDTMLVMMSMDGHFDIVRLALFDRGGLRVTLEAGSSTRGDERYLECNLGEDRRLHNVDEPDGKEDGSKASGEHIGEEEMGRCTREEQRVLQRRLERRRQGTKGAQRVNTRRTSRCRQW